MDPANLNQPSFIPKQALARTVPEVKTGISLFTVIAIVILFLSLALLAGGYVFQNLLAKQINGECSLLSDGVTRVCGLRLSLDNARESLGESVLQKIERLDQKLKVINKLLGAHVVLTPVFDQVLAPLTLQSIQYKKFTYNNGTVTLEGIARSYQDIAVQANKFNQEKMIKNFIFSNLDLDSKGNIVFSLQLTFDPALTRYNNYTLIKSTPAVSPVVSPAPILPNDLPVAPAPTPEATSTATSSSINL